MLGHINIRIGISRSENGFFIVSDAFGGSVAVKTDEELLAAIRDRLQPEYAKALAGLQAAIPCQPPTESFSG